MMGPTPVSALLHAATMVTAGIYLIIRIMGNYEFDQSLYIFGLLIGLFTIILGGFIALFQNDMKKIIAYSTCSQLGYMYYSLFLDLFNSSYFHLFIHGFFKCLLFLSAGIIIHSFNNNQDLRKLPSLIFNFPFSYFFFLFSTFSIISFPFYSSFYSKEFILEFSYFNSILIYSLSLFGALLTISYSFKLFFNLFFNPLSF
jgi:NADH:ubiquinone oxidoreductase subunit 5 (subunit L)/multisubunit Na+/H+ antiporter MnhA subunit